MGVWSHSVCCPARFVELRFEVWDIYSFKVTWKWYFVKIKLLSMVLHVFQVPSSTSHWLEKLLELRHVLDKNFSLHVKMCGVFRILEARRLEVFAAQRWKIRRTGPLCKLTPSLVVQQQNTCSHCRKMQEKNLFFGTYKLTTRTFMYCTYVCSIFDRGKVCLDWRHKRGRRSYSPRKTLSIF